MGKKILKNMDWGILVCIVILLAIGLVALFSATQGTEYEEFKKQIMWLAISIPIMIILTFVDYNTISKISPILYVLMIISLIAVMFTKSVNGATSWFTIGSVSIQPAEFAKIIAIISLSTYVAKIQEKGSRIFDKIRVKWFSKGQKPEKNLQVGIGHNAAFILHIWFPLFENRAT